MLRERERREVRGVGLYLGDGKDMSREMVFATGGCLAVFHDSSRIVNSKVLIWIDSQHDFINTCVDLSFCITD